MAYEYVNGKPINYDSHTLKDLGYTGSSNADFDAWFSGLSDAEKQYINTENPVLLQYIKAYNSTTDPYIRQQLEGFLSNFNSQKFSPTLLQSLGEAFGDTSARQNFLNQASADFSTSITKLLEGKHVEDYTDPSAEIARRKLAGINDDLNGGSQIGTGDPAQIDNSEPQPGIVNDGQSAVQSVAQIGTSIVSFAMQMYTGFQNIRSLSLENNLKELSLSDNMRDLAWNVISEGVDEFLGSNKGKYSREEMLDPSFVQLAPSLVRSFGSRINSLPLNRRQRKVMHTLVDDLVFTYDENMNKVPTSKYQTLINGMNTDLFKSRNALAQASGLVGADTSDIDALRAIGEDIYKPLNEQSLQIASALNRVTQLQAQFDTSYLEEANRLGLGSVSAGAEFASRKLVKEMKEAQNTITKSFKNIRNKILNDKKLGEKWKTALLTGTSIAEVFTMNTLLSSTANLNFGIRSSVHDTRDTYVHHD